MTLLELRDKRAGLLTQASEFRKRAADESRGELTPDELQQIDRILDETEKLDAEIRKAEDDAASKAAASRAAVAKLEELEKRSKQIPPRSGTPPIAPGREKDSANPLATREYEEYFEARLRCDKDRARRARNAMESRAMSLGTDSAGGYMSLPTALLNRLVSTIDEISGITGMCNRINVGDAKQIGITKVTARAEDFDWTSEITAVDEDTALTLARRDLSPTLVTKLVKMSMVLMQRSPDAQNFALQQLARALAVTMEKAALTGSGSSQPLGIFTASASGIPTSRDVTVASTTAFTYAELLTFKYTLKTAYHRNARLFVHRDFVRKALQLVDGESRPLFQPGIYSAVDARGAADTILGMPIHYSEFAPNTYEASAYVAVYGDPQFITIADAMSYSVQIVDQLYAATNQVGLIGRMEADISPILSEAFVRMKLAAS